MDLLHMTLIHISYVLEYEDNVLNYYSNQGNLQTVYKF